MQWPEGEIMGFLIAAIIIGIVGAILVRVYVWIASKVASTPDGVSPVLDKFKSGLLLEDYQKKEYRD
jgi:hypothetical protein